MRREPVTGGYRPERTTPDRRVSGPRREAERHLHYAKEALLAAALAADDAYTLTSDQDDEDRSMIQLRDAAAAYRRADEAAR